MTRFIQQKIKPLISRFIPNAWCPACGKTKPDIPVVPQNAGKPLSDGKKREKSTKPTAKKTKS